MPAYRESVPVSVIIPCFNCQITISRAIESVVQQSTQPAEIILVDDGNADCTLETLRKIANQHPKDWIKIISLNKNEGPGSARNAGWNVARGAYIAFLDADDAWHPKKLELQYRWMNAHPDVVLTGHGTQRLEEVAALRSQLEELRGQAISGRRLLLSNRFPTRSVMLKRDIPFRFLPGKRHAEDYLLWLQIVLAGHPAHYLNAILAFSYKPDFGSAGLSSHLWRHEKGELATFNNLHQEGLISLPMHFAASTISILKFLRRTAITFFSRES